MCIYLEVNPDAPHIDQITQPSIVHHIENSAEQNELTEEEYTPPSCLYSSVEPSPISLTETDPSEEEIAIQAHDFSDGHSHHLMSSTTLEEPTSKKVCIGGSISSTTPFLLMQKMLRGETDLHLPAGP